MKNAKNDASEKAKELAVLLSDGSNKTAPSTSFGDLKASAARAMDTKISSPDLPTVSQVRASLPDLPTARQIRGSLPSLPAASQVRASLPSLPTDGMRELAASLRPDEGTFKNMRGSLPSMPTLPSLPSSIRPVIGVSFGGSGR